MALYHEKAPHHEWLYIMIRLSIMKGSTSWMALHYEKALNLENGSKSWEWLYNMNGSTSWMALHHENCSTKWKARHHEKAQHHEWLYIVGSVLKKVKKKRKKEKFLRSRGKNGLGYNLLIKNFKPVSLKTSLIGAAVFPHVTHSSRSDLDAVSFKWSGLETLIKTQKKSMSREKPIRDLHLTNTIIYLSPSFIMHHSFIMICDHECRRSQYYRSTSLHKYVIKAFSATILEHKKWYLETKLLLVL